MFLRSHISHKETLSRVRAMPEHKRQKKTVSTPLLKGSITEILVASGRSFQPYIRTFKYTGENIAKSNLGTLVGVFEIDEQSEDCAYIVNFLASVAKKEYFSNGRRGAVESFEAALHKINLALSELVKHGNVAWLGKFHGALGVLEKNNFHFSLTGQASILLLRNDTLSDIGQGLASLESHLHPIKTFIEVSSGRLELSDRVILASPELVALFGEDELTKNMRRMDHEHFIQFLKTALINELDMSGVVHIEMAESFPEPLTTPAKKTTRGRSLERIQNIFSQSAFTKNPDRVLSVTDSLKEREQLLQDEESKEYTDQKTGHIYVSGENDEALPERHRFERLSLHFENSIDILRSFMLRQGKHLRRSKKTLTHVALRVAEEGRFASKKLGRAVRRNARKLTETIRNRFAQTEEAGVNTGKGKKSAPIEKTVVVTDIPLPLRSSEEQRGDEVRLVAPLEHKKDTFQEISIPAGKTPEVSRAETVTSGEDPSDTLPHFIKEKVSSFYQKTGENRLRSTLANELLERAIRFYDSLGPQGTAFVETVSRLFQKVGKVVRRITPKSSFSWRELPSPFRHLSPRQKKRFLIALFISLPFALILFFFLGRIPKSEEASTEIDNVTQEKTPPSSTNNSLPGGLSVLDTPIDDPVLPLTLNDENYLIGKQSIFALSTQKSFKLPSGIARFATAMDDLRLIFVYTEDGKLYAWSPISATFIENSLALPEGAQVAGIGSYLTYLYVLDSASDQVYRFPRAEGGFGAGVSWLKDTVQIDKGALFALGENVFISREQSITSYFRGRVSNNFDTGASDGVFISIYTHPGFQNVYGLNRDHARVVIWNQEGRVIQEFSHEQLEEGQALSVNEKTGEVLVSTKNSLLSFKLK